MAPRASSFGAMSRTLAAVAILFAILAAPARAGGPSVLVELYTSQGCSACPPADRLLAELAEREGVVALSLHVDYWDYLGWRDSFAQKRFTKRQYAYRDRMGLRMVYTPQMIVHGSAELQGTQPERVAALIAAARREGAGARVSIAPHEGMLVARLEPAGGKGGVVWVAGYHDRGEVSIESGENAGRDFTYRNVVHSLTRLGHWDGTAPREIELPAPAPGGGVALWVQGEDLGPVRAVARYEP